MQEVQQLQAVRLDKWLWAARFYKTRAIAQDAISGGKVHYDGQRVKPGKQVRVGGKINLRQGYDDKEVIIKAISDKRRSAPEAQTLYEETSASIAAREAAAEQRRQLGTGSIPPSRRPDKKQRRQINRFRDQADNPDHSD